jgi:hypothetical protein
MKNIFDRINGYVWGAYDEFNKNPFRYGGRLNSHIESTWTSNEHFAHDNYQRGHLPQLCIVASGWKAKLLALIFWPPAPYKPTEIVWRKNGDHPYDNVWRPYEDTGKIPTEPRKGEIVRYFRHPTVDDKSVCKKCGDIMHNHGWMDDGGEGKTVCPGTKIRV